MNNVNTVSNKVHNTSVNHLNTESNIDNKFNNIENISDKLNELNKNYEFKVLMNILKLIIMK